MTVYPRRLWVEKKIPPNSQQIEYNKACCSPAVCVLLWNLVQNLLLDSIVSFVVYPRFAPIGLMDRRGMEHFLVEQRWVFGVARFNIVQNELINDSLQNSDREIMRRTRGRDGGGEERRRGGELRLDDYYLAQLRVR